MANLNRRSFLTTLGALGVIGLPATKHPTGVQMVDTANKITTGVQVVDTVLDGGWEAACLNLVYGGSTIHLAVKTVAAMLAADKRVTVLDFDRGARWWDRHLQGINTSNLTFQDVGSFSEILDLAEAAMHQDFVVCVTKGLRPTSTDISRMLSLGRGPATVLLAMGTPHFRRSHRQSNAPQEVLRLASLGAHMQRDTQDPTRVHLTVTKNRRALPKLLPPPVSWTV